MPFPQRKSDSMVDSAIHTADIAPSRARTFAFVTVSASVAMAACVCIYFAFKIHWIKEEIEQLSNRRTAIRTAELPGSAPSPDETNHANSQEAGAPDTAAHITSERWKWVPDAALIEQQARQALAAVRYDRLLIRGAENQFRLRLRFSELYEILGLSEAEILAFEQEASEAGLTFNPLLTANPVDAYNHSKAQAGLMDKIVEETLGRDYVEPFREFLTTSDVRDMSRQFAAFSLGAGEPMDANRVASLVQTCLEFRQSGEGSIKITLDQINWESVATKSTSYLSPIQQQLLRAMIDQRKFDQVFQDITGLPLHRPIRGLPSL